VVFAVDARQAIIGEERRVTTLHDRIITNESEASHDLPHAGPPSPFDRNKTEQWLYGTLP
jgi:hypothetical protein